MIVVKEKTTVTLTLAAASQGHARTDVQVRDLSTIIDEPTARGGTNLGPTPTEMLGAALLGCTTVISNRVAAQMGIELAALNMTLDATFDRRGVSLAEEVDVPFPAMHLRVVVSTAANEEQIAQLRKNVRKFCPISKVLRSSGTLLEETWEIERS